MNIELSDECFVDMLFEKYKFDKDEEGKVKVVFDKLSIEELISLLSIYEKISPSGTFSFSISFGS